MVDLLSQNIEERNAGSKSFTEIDTFIKRDRPHMELEKKKKKKDLRDYLADLRESKANLSNGSSLG